MSSKIVRDIAESINLSVKVYDYRAKLDSADDWDSVLNEIKENINGNIGLLRIQIGNDIKYSSTMSKNDLTTNFINNFLKMFQVGDLHSYDEIISITFICI